MHLIAQQDINFEKATLQVAQVIELVGWQMSLKEPKTDRSRRSIALSTRVVQELRHHRKTQAEECLRLGCGRFEVFSSLGRHDPQPEQF